MVSKMEVVYGKFSTIYSICDVKEKLSDSAILHLLAPSVFNPTFERLLIRAKKYQADDKSKVYAYSENGEYKGIIVFKTEDNTAEILDIAVKPEYRKHGIGKSLIDFIFTQFPIDTITAETDDEAVEFYKRCGFNVIGFGMKCNNKRYICNKLKF